MTGNKSNGRNGTAARKGNGAKRGQNNNTTQPRARNMVAKAPAVAKGATAKKNAMGGTMVATKAGLDAFSNSHLSLPRPVSSYTVMRVTRRLDSENAKAILISPFNYQQTASSTGDRGNWSNIVGIKATDTAVATSAANAWETITLPTGTTSWAGKTVTPSAVSVRVYNPGALQTTAGVVTLGRISGEPNWDGSNLTIESRFDGLMNYQAPSVLSAGELALKPRQIDAVPLDFSAVSDFTDFYSNHADTTFTWNTSNGWRPAGFTPIFIKNPNQLDLKIEICVEFRVRFDPDSPYAITQKHYPPSAMSTWDRIMREACQANANGVRPIPGHR